MFVMNSCNGGKDSYEKHKQMVLNTEKNNPIEFLQLNVDSKVNLIGVVVIDGSIMNKATMATYKDAVVHVDYLSKTNSVLGSDEQTVMEFFKPNTSVEVKLKFPGYKGTKSAMVKLKSATALSE